VVSAPDAKISIVTTKSLEYPCDILAIDTSKDLAIIRVKRSAQAFPFVKLQKSKEYVGQDILIIGHPAQFYWTVSKGIITRLYLVVAYPSIFSKRIETDGYVNSGSSGGPVFSEKGELVGVVSAMWLNMAGQPMGIGILIPVSEVRRFLKQNSSKMYPPISKPRYRLGDLK
jgi:serine protease Do